MDASKPALETARRNVELNQLSAPHRVLAGDCFSLLPDLDRRYDLVVLDPPAFVKHRAALKRGLRGYEQINYEVARQIAPGGIIFTFSCSELVTEDLFRQAVMRGAARTGRRAVILARLTQAPCHPVSLYHPEGAYLKGLVLRVE